MNKLNEAKPRESGLALIGDFVKRALSGESCYDVAGNQKNLFAAHGAMQWIDKYIPDHEADDSAVRAHFDKLVGLAGKRGLKDPDKLYKSLSNPSNPYNDKTKNFGLSHYKTYNWRYNNLKDSYHVRAKQNFIAIYKNFLRSAANALHDYDLKSYASKYDVTIEDLEDYVSTGFAEQHVYTPSYFELTDDELPSFEELLAYVPGFGAIQRAVDEYDATESEIEAVDTSVIPINEKEWEKMFNYYKKNSKINFNAITDKQKCLSRYVIAELLGWKEAARDAASKLRDFGMSREEIEAYARSYLKNGAIPDKYKDEIKALQDEGIGAAGEANHNTGWVVPKKLTSFLDKEGVPYTIQNANTIYHYGNMSRNGREYGVSKLITLWPKTEKLELKFTNHTNEGGGSYGYSLSGCGAHEERTSAEACLCALRTIVQLTKIRIGTEETNKVKENAEFTKILEEGLVIPRKVQAQISAGDLSIRNDRYAELLLQQAKAEKDPIKRAIALERYDSYIKKSKGIRESSNDVTDDFEEYTLALSDIPGTEQGPRAIKESLYDEDPSTQGTWPFYMELSRMVEELVENGISADKIKSLIADALDANDIDY